MAEPEAPLPGETGSGDTFSGYIERGFGLVLAVGAAAAWTAMDPGRRPGA